MSYEDAIKWLENLKNDIGNPHYECLWHYAQAIEEICALLEEQESVIEALKSDLNETLEVLVQKPEVVLCKDCKRKDTLSCPKAPVRPDDWFCADGERKSNGNEID